MIPNFGDVLSTSIGLHKIVLWITAGILCFASGRSLLSQDTLPLALTQRTADEYVNQGMKWNAQGRHKRASAYFSKAIELDPTHAVAFCARANSRLHLGKPDLALADCNEAIRLAPGFAPAYYNRGIIRSEVGQPDKAVADFTEAIRLDPKHELAYHNRGNMLRRRGEYDNAIADFNEAIRLNSKYSLAYYNRGLVWYDKRQYEKALADYNRALEIGLGEPYEPHFHNAIAWTKATCPDLSIRDGKTALEHAKNACGQTELKDCPFLETLAAAYAQANEFEKAVATIKLAVDRAHKDRRKHLETCLARYKSGMPYGTEESPLDKDAPK